MKLVLNHELLKEMISQDLVKVQKHPEADLFIYNYTQKAQFERVWNEITLLCRGLILDNTGNIVARPFTKFFNLGESEDQMIPEESFEVFEKMDGSLGILYWLNDRPFIATRGSFSSEQSERANKLLYERYQHVFPLLDKTKTYLFEIIYPENRIVIDYKDLEDLVLLAVVDTKSGLEHIIEDIGFPVVRKYDGLRDLSLLETMEEDNKEGFVIRFSGGLRYKVKFREYVRIHRIVTQVSNITIWEYLKDNKSLDELIERVPDEFFSWVRQTSHDLKQAYTEIENIAKSEYKELETRKETALYFLTCRYPSVLFLMLDKKDYTQAIWKMLRPNFSRPFSSFTDEL